MKNNLKIPKWIKVMTLLPVRSISEIWKTNDIAYSHLIYIINDLEKKHLVKSKRTGVIRTIELTANGEALKVACGICLKYVEGKG